MRRQRANTSKRHKSRNNKENEGDRPPRNDLEIKASLKLQELSEIDDNIMELGRSVPLDSRNYDLSGWN